MLVSACNPSYSGSGNRGLAWTQVMEVAVGRDCATAFQARQQNKTVSNKQKQKLQLTQVQLLAAPLAHCMTLPSVTSVSLATKGNDGFYLVV